MNFSWGTLCWSCTSPDQPVRRCWQECLEWRLALDGSHHSASRQANASCQRPTRPKAPSKAFNNLGDTMDLSCKSVIQNTERSLTWEKWVFLRLEGNLFFQWLKQRDADEEDAEEKGRGGRRWWRGRRQSLRRRRWREENEDYQDKEDNEDEENEVDKENEDYQDKEDLWRWRKWRR